MKFSRWQNVKYDKNFRAYVRIMGNRYHLVDDVHQTRKYMNGTQFHAVTWCGYYYIQYNHTGDEARYIRVN